ncbi:MAG: hypothetical protein QOG35_1766 [Solirubrobacteraceae bacterium]|jgi:nucleotide-binding universal stress UspA family protein|nr:hypothetical protein [Solirubrobacteraceae bacterium]
MTKPILVGHDPRRVDDAPVSFGATIARVTGAPLVVAMVEARSPVLPISEGQSLAYALVEDELMPDCAPALEALEAELRAAGVAVECRPLPGVSAARALQEAAEEEDAGLLVIGSSRRSAPGRVLAGSTAERLLHGAPCPIAVVPSEWTSERPLATIGVAYAHGPEGDEALRSAHALARRLGASLRVITVVKVTLGMYGETEPSVAGQTGKRLEDVEGEHKARVEDELRRLVAGLDGDVPTDVDVFVGDPADVLVELSPRLDLLVCGSRGYGPLRAVLLGSVSRRIVAEAHCPVIVLPRGVKASLEALVTAAPGAAAPA